MKEVNFEILAYFVHPANARGFRTYHVVNYYAESEAAAIAQFHRERPCSTFVSIKKIKFHR